MAYPSYIRDKARRMRTERRMTIDEIAERLAVSRTSVFGWVRDLPFDANTPARSAAQLRAARANSDRARERREVAYAEGASQFAALIGEPSFRDFLCLYLAEGYKRNRNVVSIANSDALVLAVALLWMQRLSAKQPVFSLQYHADQDLDELRSYWGQQLAIDGGAIRMQRKSNSGQLTGRTWRSAHGVLAIWMHDTMFRARLQAWLDLLRAEWSVESAPSGRGAVW